VTPGGGPDSLNPRYILILAVAAGLILSLGWVLKPGERVSEPVAAGSQAELSRLPALTQRRELEEMADFFGELAADLAPALVRLRSVGRSGVVWSEDRVVTARLAWRFPAAITVAASGGDVGAYTTVSGPHLPLAGLRTPRLDGRAPPPRRRAGGGDVETGHWVLAIWQTEAELAFAPGNSLGTASRACGDQRVVEMVTTMPIQPAMLGGGLFDLDGNLLAVLLRCDGHDIAVTVTSVDELLADGETHQSRLRARWGLTVEPLQPSESFYFGLGDGLMVRELWERYPAEATGVRPGDILMSLDGALLESVEDLRVLEGDEAPNQETFRLEARRGKDTVTIDLPARGIDAPIDASGPDSAGLVWDQPAAGYLIASVLPGSRAAEAGIRAADRLVRVDHAEPASFDAVQAVLSEDRDEPTFVELARDGRIRGVLLP
jgi:S1-C subfamily serine protease